MALREPRQTKHEKETWEGSAASWPGVHEFYSTSNATASQDAIWYEDAMNDHQGRVLLVTAVPGSGKMECFSKLRRDDDGG